MRFIYFLVFGEGCEPFGYRIYPYFFEKIIRNRMSGDL